MSFSPKLAPTLATTFAGLLFFTSGVFATEASATTSAYMMNMQIFVDSALVSSPKIIAKSDETAKLTQVSENPHRELKVKVVAAESPNESLNESAKSTDAIVMKFDVSYLANGKTVQASPQIIARAGENASIEVGAVDGKPEMKLTVTATRQ